VIFSTCQQPTLFTDEKASRTQEHDSEAREAAMLQLKVPTDAFEKLKFIFLSTY